MTLQFTITDPKPTPVLVPPARRPRKTASTRGQALRQAAPLDYPAIIALLDAAHLPHDDLRPDHLDDFLLASGASALEGVVGLEGVGSARLLRSLAVAERAQGQGLGHRLMRGAEDRARESGAEALWLLTTTAEDFFARAGYARAARESAPKALRLLTEFASVCPSTAVCMTKRL